MDPTRQKNSLFLTLIAAVWLGACGKPGDSRPRNHDPLNSDVPPEMTMDKMKTQSFGPEGLEWELITPTAQGFAQQNKMHATDIEILLYDKGLRSTRLTADEGVIRFEDARTSTSAVPIKLKEGAIGMGPGDLYLTGNVVAVSTDGSKLYTDWLRYDKAGGLITSTAPVRVVRDDSVTEGVGMEAAVNLSQVKIFKQTVTIKEKAIKKRSK